MGHAAQSQWTCDVVNVTARYKINSIADYLCFSSFGSELLVVTVWDSTCFHKLCLVESVLH